MEAEKPYWAFCPLSSVSVTEAWNQLAILLQPACQELSTLSSGLDLVLYRWDPVPAPGQLSSKRVEQGSSAPSWTPVWISIASETLLASCQLLRSGLSPQRLSLRQSSPLLFHLPGDHGEGASNILCFRHTWETSV